MRTLCLHRKGQGMKLMASLALLATSAVFTDAALAQPADLPIPAATAAQYPPGVAVGAAGGSPVYVDGTGRTLYGMDMRTLLRFSVDASQYCQGVCAERWEPMLAPADAKPNVAFPRGFSGAASRQAAPSDIIPNQRAPDWTIIAGPQGPQWVYKGWHMVFVRKGDAPGSAAFDGADDRIWNTLKFIPPVPKLVAPANVGSAFVEGGYVLVGTDGRLLFTGLCGSDCSGWRVFSAAAASRGVGDWSVNRDADSPQWAYRGNPVFVAQTARAADLPPGATVLRP